MMVEPSEGDSLQPLEPSDARRFGDGSLAELFELVTTSSDRREIWRDSVLLMYLSALQVPESFVPGTNTYDHNAPEPVESHAPASIRFFAIKSAAHVDSNSVSVGRQRKVSDIHIPDSTVSKLHARFTLAPDGRCYVEDLGSRNGTFVHEARLDPGERVLLLDGVMVRFGRVRMTYMSAESLPRLYLAYTKERQR